MLNEIGIEDIEELFTDIPSEVRLKRDLELPGPMSEYEVLRELKSILNKNISTLEMPTFLGGGVWPHYIPTHVSTLAGRSEFYTAYTPYQGEISQGALQALWEYQSMVCELTGMEVANASMYDWGSALGEAALMSMRVTKRNEFIVPKAINPERITTLKTYTRGAGAIIKEIAYDTETGMIKLDELEGSVSEKTAGVYIENPNYFGVIETQVNEIQEIIQKNGSLFVVGADPISLGILEAPGEYGADIVVGEGQPLGNAMNFGGPLLGVFGCKSTPKLIRSMPGRLIGMTSTQDGEMRGYVMTMQTREQHIRREKATSNICSNEALCAITAGIYMATIGPGGLKKLGEICMTNSNYTMKKINEINGFKAPIFKAPHLKEFTVNVDDLGTDIKTVHEKLLQRKIHGGKAIKKEFPELGETALYCVTEVHLKQDIDKLIGALKEIAGG